MTEIYFENVDDFLDAIETEICEAEEEDGEGYIQIPMHIFIGDYSFYPNDMIIYNRHVISLNSSFQKAVFENYETLCEFMKDKKNDFCGYYGNIYIIEHGKKFMLAKYGETLILLPTNIKDETINIRIKFES